MPQGGALSCFISNLLLHSVDEAVNNKRDDNLLYLRFCDDMIILHTDKAECENALKRYEEAITRLKFIIHAPEEVVNYSKKFWRVKSKKPYKWALRSGEPKNVPWLSFVGYQIKHDNSIRIRKKSLQKELKKQNEECQQILKSVNFKEKEDINSISKKSKKQQLFALENRLISMSVGRIELYDKGKPQSLCWTNGFKALNKNPTSIKQLKLLDRNRTKQLYEVKKGLSELVKPTENPDLRLRKKVLGSPFSYHNFILRKT